MNRMRMVRVVGAVCAAAACSAIVSAQTKQPPTIISGLEQKKLARLTDQPVLGLQGFSVVLVLGDMQGSATADNIPAAARKALGDMKDFLPYKSYRLLDSAWILGSSNLAARLRGPEDQEYRLNLFAGASRDDSKPLSLTFQLSEGETPKAATGPEGEGAASKAQVVDLIAKRNAAEQTLRDLQAARNEKHPDVVKAESDLKQLTRQIGELQGRVEFKKMGGGCCIISTGFTMDVGETVVVGTSRLRGGDKALIALLTAVPKPKK